jgi:hypothetical protein
MGHLVRLVEGCMMMPENDSMVEGRGVKGSGMNLVRKSGIRSGIRAGPFSVDCVDRSDS